MDFTFLLVVRQVKTVQHPVRLDAGGEGNESCDMFDVICSDLPPPFVVPMLLSLLFHPLSWLSPPLHYSIPLISSHLISPHLLSSLFHSTPLLSSPLVCVHFASLSSLLS